MASLAAPVSSTVVAAGRRGARALAVVLVLSALALAGAATLGFERRSASSAAVAERPAAAGTLAPQTATAAQERSFARLPLGFVANAGQSARGVRFMAQAAGVGFYFLRDRVVLDVRRAQPKQGVELGQPASLEPGASPFANAKGAAAGVALQLRFAGANPHPRLVARDVAAGKVSYLNGAGPAHALSSYRELVYRDLWPGIDMAFRGERGRLKYEFRIAPGADPSAIRLAYHGAEGLAVGSDRALRIRTALGTLRDARPVSYQRLGGRRLPVASRFALSGRGYRFALGGYLHDRPLVIDPGLDYSTFLGGGGSDDGFGVAVDASGQAYVTGQTVSGAFPTTPGAYDESINGGFDAFVAKLNAAGSGLVYSTFLGGGGSDLGKGIAVDASGQAYVTGFTVSGDFPTTPGAHDESINDEGDAFVAKLNAAGSGLVYSTFLGGEDFDEGFGIAVDASGGAYVTGFTGSGGFPTTPGTYDESINGNGDAFAAKLNAAGSGLVYSTFLGGSGLDEGFGVAVDASGQAYVTGDTNSAGFPTTPGAYDESHNGARDVFVAKLNAAGSGFVYSTFLGGGGDFDEGFGIAVDASGQAYVTGGTQSADFPTTPGAYDQSFNGLSSDAFVAKLNAAGSGLVYSTFLGGGNFDEGLGIAVDASGRAYVTGETNSSGFPTTPGAYDQSFNGVEDAFAAKLNAAGSGLVYSTFLGGGGRDEGFGVAVDASGRAYVTGDTNLADFPTTPGAYDDSHNGGADVFVSKLNVLGQCEDGVDNDSDGKVDFPADQQCDSASDVSERPQCSDGFDNDGDGTEDYPKDPGCVNAKDNSESPDPQCGDGLDNDNDSATDYPADTGCVSRRDNSESPTPQCSDGIDNDNDTRTDYPADTGCASTRDNSESPDPQCSNGADDDGDTRTDYPADAGCSSASDNSESPDPQCGDGLDNDNDGLTDYPADTGCVSRRDNSESPTPQCSDGLDNDSDGAQDYPADAGCASRRDNSEN